MQKIYFLTDFYVKGIIVVRFLHKAHQILLKDLEMDKIHLVVDRFHNHLVTNNHQGFLDLHHHKILLQPQ